MSKGQSLADKLAALTNPTPQFDHQEDEDEDTVTGAKVTEGDYENDDLGAGDRSYLRTVNAPNLDDDSRYQGKKIKRKDFQKDRDFMEHSSAELGHMFDVGDQDDDDEEEEEDTEDDDIEDEEEFEEENADSEIENEIMKPSVEELGSSNEVNTSDDDDKEDEEDSDEDDEDGNEEDGDAMFDVDISSFSQNQDMSMEEKQENLFKVNETDSLFAKGLAVTSQLSSWDKLLEQRILLQKMLTKVNTFPQNLKTFMDPQDEEHAKLVSKTSKSLSSLLLKTAQLKNCLERKAVEDSKGIKRSLDDMNEWLAEDFASGETRRRERIGMWSDRTQKLGSMASMNTPTLEQIDQIVANMPRLVKRTKLARVECNILGEVRGQDEAESQQENENIFDDSDFYHHLLRELIEKKTTSSTESGEVGKHWLQIQKLRSKLKKKVDARASKGRKVRYDIHTKLVNFMAPVRLSDQMPDNSRQELFSSLFGARKY